MLTALAVLATAAIHALAIVIIPPPRGYPPGSWGAGPGPRGLSNSPGVGPGPSAAIKAKPGPFTVNEDHLFIINSTGVAQRCPPLFVPAGTLLAIRAHNGTDNGNQHVVRVARQPEFLTGVLGTVLTPDTQISWPVDQCDQIWFIGTAADGIIVSLQRGRIS